MTRAFDVLFSFVGLVLTAPFVIPYAVLLRLDSPGPLFLRQWRFGHEGRPFASHTLQKTITKSASVEKNLATAIEKLAAVEQ